MNINDLYNILFETRSISVADLTPGQFRSTRSALHKKLSLLSSLIGKQSTLRASRDELTGISRFWLTEARTNIEFKVIDDAEVSRTVEADSCKRAGDSSMSSECSGNCEESNREGEVSSQSSQEIR